MNVQTTAVTDVRQSLRRLAIGHRILAMEGHNDITLGHMSLRDPEGRGLWLKKSRRGLDEIFDVDDYVLIDFDGKLLESDGPCHAEWPIHTEIMKARSDVMVVGHTHARHAGVAQGLFRKAGDVVAQHLGACRRVGLAMHEEASRSRDPLPCEHLDELRLPVA